MTHVKDILVPVDVHENAAPVVQWAACLATMTKSRLTLLHVNESLELVKARPGLHGAGIPGLDVTVEKWRREYRQSARQVLDQLAQHCGELSVSLLQLEGRAPATILGAIDATPSQLVVMGTHGRPWYQRAFLGSTAEAVLRASPVPLLIVHNQDTRLPEPRFECVLWASDFSAAAESGQAWLQYLMEHGPKKGVLVHAIENPLLDEYEPDQAKVDIQQIMAEARDHPPRSAQPYWQHAREVAERKLREIRQQLLGPPVSAMQVHVVVEEGGAAQTVVEVAERQQVDVIIMATHGRTGVRRFVVGSVTEKVLRTSPCPILAVPSKPR
ncbi:MAG: universal stress protein [Candidatus Binatia bacterium]